KITSLEDLLKTSVYYDGTGRMDYAARGAGASIVSELTSDTYTLGTHVSTWSPFWRSGKRMVGNPPVFAILPDTRIGSCWPMKGRRGSLGIALAQPTIVRAFTIDHIPRQLTLDYQTAPREGDLWGFLEHTSPYIKEGTNLTTHALDNILAGDTRGLRRSSYGRGRLVHLSSFNFDALAGQPFQTFEVPTSTLADLGEIAFGVVVLMVRENWGNEHFTCIYRVRVH
ncbi:hypothetical protein GY45DRAFT_1264616, partial [Cubamyces sp. BRFM 1775]